jgi:hypothetical protein
MLLAATAVEGGLRLSLARPVLTTTTVEAADRDVWTPIVELADGGDTAGPLPVVLQPGTAIRLVDAGGRRSNVVFVLGQRALRRSIRHQGRVLVDPDTVSADIAGAEAFAQDLVGLLSWLPQNPPRPSGGSDGAPNADAKTLEHETWEHYLERCEAAIGEHMLHFALPLPELVPPDLPDESTTEEQTDGDTGEPPVEPDTPAPDLSQLSARRRRRRQRWCQQLVDASPHLVQAGRLAALRLLRRQASYGLWNDPAEWVPLIATATAALGNKPAPYPRERAAVASMAACGLAMVRHEVRRFGGYDPTRAAYEGTLAAVRQLLPEATESLIERYSSDLDADPALGLPATEIMDIATQGALADPIDIAVETLAKEFDQKADRDGDLITISDELPSTALRHAVLRAVGLAQNAQPVAAVATGEGHRVVCAWCAPHLVFVFSTPWNAHGALYHLGYGVGPRYFAEHPDDEMPKAERWMKAVPPAKALKALEEAGVRDLVLT